MTVFFSRLALRLLLLVGLGLAPLGAQAFWWGGGQDRAEIPVARLPPEAVHTLALIQRGGPFPYTKDGTEFRNREGLLPKRPPGYYREYTVKTPGAPNRGARRIVAGQGGEAYYTADHYRTFQRIRE